MSKLSVRKFGVGVASLALVAGVVGPASAADTDNRLAGADRYETAIKVSEEWTTSPVVYVARGDELVDAVAAGSLKGGPLLLVSNDAKVTDAVAARIKKLGAAKVIAIGGDKVVTDETLKKVAGTAITERIAGKDRYETAAKIAEKYPAATGLAVSAYTGPAEVYLANGKDGLVDALAGGQLTKGPILLTDGTDSLPAATAEYLNKKAKSASVYGLGGTGVVSDAALKNAAVAQVILKDSFVTAAGEALKAKALASLEVNGWLRAGVTIDKVLADRNDTTDKVAESMIRATFPRVDRSLVKNNGAHYVQISKDEDAASGWKTETTLVDKDTARMSDVAKEKDGSEAVNYVGATGAVAVAAAKVTAANTAKSTLDTALRGTSAAKLFGYSNASGTSTVNVTTVVVTNLAEFKAVFGEDKMKGIDDTVGTGTKWNVLLNRLGISLPTNGTTYADTSGANDEAPTRFAEFQALETSAIESLRSAVSAASTAAVKAQTALTKANSDYTAASSFSGSPATSVNRLAGADRYETALKIAQHVFGEKANADGLSKVYFASGTAIPDAAVSGMLTAGPVLLVSKDSASSTVKEYAKAIGANTSMSRKNIKFLGGTGVIDDKFMTETMQLISPLSADAAKEYTASFSVPSLDKGTAQASPIESGGGDTAAVLKITPTVTKVPSGGTQKITWEYNTGDGWKTLEYKADAVHDLTAANNVTSGEYQLTMTATGNASVAKSMQLRLVVQIVNQSGDDIVAKVVSQATTLWYKTA